MFPQVGSSSVVLLKEEQQGQQEEQEAPPTAANTWRSSFWSGTRWSWRGPPHLTGCCHSAEENNKNTKRSKVTGTDCGPISCRYEQEDVQHMTDSSLLQSQRRRFLPLGFFLRHLSVWRAYWVLTYLYLYIDLYRYLPTYLSIMYIQSTHFTIHIPKCIWAAGEQCTQSRSV